MGEVIEFPSGRRITRDGAPHSSAESDRAAHAPSAPVALPTGHRAGPATDAADEHRATPGGEPSPDAPEVTAPTRPTAPRRPTQVTPSSPSRATPPSSPSRARPSRPSPRTRPLLWRQAAGHALRTERHEQDRTLADVAEAAGVSTQYLSEVERGRKEPSSEVLEAIGGALGLDLADLTHRVAHSLRPASPSATLRAA